MNLIKPNRHVRRNYEPQTWDQGIDTSVDPDTGEIIEFRASQEQKDECDINVILKRFERTGALPDMIKREPAYGDFATMPDFMHAMNIVAHANEQFDGLDAHIRKRFGNDPAEFLAFANDPTNQDEMIKLGLAKRKPETLTPDPLAGSVSVGTVTSSERTVPGAKTAPKKPTKEVGTNEET